MTTDYDIITVGGGLGGAALAKSMAERGYRVLVVERETQFKDRVRGEWLAPWGVVETKELGIYDLLMESCGHHPVWFDTRLGPAPLGDRDLAETTPGGCHSMTFYHPAMQEALIAAAEKAGAEVRRQARVRGIDAGAELRARLESNGHEEAVSARLIVGVDGRQSLVRKWAGFETSEIPAINQICGIFFDDIPAPEDRSVNVLNPFLQRLVIVFPQGHRRARVYLANRIDEGIRLQGEKDVPRFIEEVVKTGIDAAYFEGAHADGPLATFPGVYEWVERPYKDGIALVGDAACTSDPTWGQGLSLTVRGVRALRDALLADDDWERAGAVYAADHAQFWGTSRTVEGWFSELFFSKGPEADEMRGRVFGRIAQDPEMLHDCGFSGPDAAPADEAARRRFFGED
jgi:2-polyprenyl-6-methoxyphenol hydroxylase-like FAD-dependent oxidoreductase